MSSRKEEERNEKIIRGLMKLPPNRKCINCNSLGPQYVCTNFWTFICMTCSGIHREFTHRVKSVSMSKFTSQEVEALQKGGNQRARETYLKDWDPQRQILPHNSNADKVREFIKNVYVDRRYAAGKSSDKPPRDTENFRNHGEETRRASSYHSYSQSPPYDYQYEERLYGRQALALGRRPGSDRSLYEGKVSSFFSPSHLSDQMSEDRFANEGSNHRVSDYSLSSVSDSFRSHPQSPNFQRYVGSPSSQTSGDTFNEDSQHQRMSSFTEANTKRHTNGLPCPQRTASSGSFGSFDSNSMSFKLVNSVNLVDVGSQPEQSAGNHRAEVSISPVLKQSSTSADFGGLDLFKATIVPQTIASSDSAIDLFQLPEVPTTPNVDLFRSPSSLVPNLDLNQTSGSKSPALDTLSRQVASDPGKKSSNEAIQKNEGWATFDIPQHTISGLGTEDTAPAVLTSNAGDPVGKLDSLLSPSTSLQWPAFEGTSAHGPSPICNLWHEDLNNIQASFNTTSTQSWNALESSIGYFPPEIIQQSGEQVAGQKPALNVNQYMDDFNANGIQRGALDSGAPISGLPLNSGGPQTHATDCKSTNPFDLPYDSDFELSNMSQFLDMGSLEIALPGGQMSTSYIDGMSWPWFPQNTVVPQDAPRGSLAFMGVQASSNQLQNVSTQGPVASVGGNPFA